MCSLKDSLASNNIPRSFTVFSRANIFHKFTRRKLVKNIGGSEKASEGAESPEQGANPRSAERVRSWEGCVPSHRVPGALSPEKNEFNVQMYLFWCIWQAERGKLI